MVSYYYGYDDRTTGAEEGSCPPFARGSFRAVKLLSAGDLFLLFVGAICLQLPIMVATIEQLVRKEGVEPSRCYPYGSEPYASASSATSARILISATSAIHLRSFCHSK